MQRGLILDRTDSSKATVPSLSHCSGLTNLFSKGYVWVSVSNVLDKSFPLQEKPRFESVLSRSRPKSAMISFLYLRSCVNHSKRDQMDWNQDDAQLFHHYTNISKINCGSRYFKKIGKLVNSPSKNGKIWKTLNPEMHEWNGKTYSSVRLHRMEEETRPRLF